MKHIFDFDSGSPIFGANDQLGFNLDGDPMLRVSGHLAMDLDTGEMHFTSGWETEEAEENDFEDEEGEF